ncbi:hypothetical protein F4604DRAFT_1618293 [Suillus subluteus]|nr:hypothetical protein F4604DRAFT_1618293 [Suillus subluteus]
MPSSCASTSSSSQTTCWCHFLTRGSSLPAVRSNICLCANLSNQSFLVYLNHLRLVDLRDLVLRAHHDRLIAISSEHGKLFPYFEGYCGTPISALAPSQRGGAVLNIASPPPRPISALNMRQQRITHYIRKQPLLRMNLQVCR